MGKKRRTFTVDFKMKAIEMYLHKGMGSKLIGRELGVTYSVIDRWIKNYKDEGILGLQEHFEFKRNPYRRLPWFFHKTFSGSLCCT